MADEQRLIYRQAWYGNRPKSVALRRESDYHTGLSFSTEPREDRPYFVYEVPTLHAAGYRVEFNAGVAIVSRWEPDWALRDANGEVRRYGSGHVSVYGEQDFWRRWYEAELAAGGDGSSAASQEFYELALEYREG